MCVLAYLAYSGVVKAENDDILSQELLKSFPIIDETRDSIVTGVSDQYDEITPRNAGRLPSLHGRESSGHSSKKDAKKKDRSKISSELQPPRFKPKNFLSDWKIKSDSTFPSSTTPSEYLPTDINNNQLNRFNLYPQVNPYLFDAQPQYQFNNFMNIPNNPFTYNGNLVGHQIKDNMVLITPRPPTTQLINNNPKYQFSQMPTNLPTRQEQLNRNLIFGFNGFSQYHQNGAQGNALDDIINQQQAVNNFQNNNGYLGYPPPINFYSRQQFPLENEIILPQIDAGFYYPNPIRNFLPRNV